MRTLLATGALMVIGLMLLLSVPLSLVGAISSSAAAQCTATPGGAAVTVATGQNVTDVWTSLIGQGFSEVATAGIMGNMQTESGFDPLRIQGGGRSTNPADAGTGGYGLVQWTPGAKLIPLLHGQPPSIPAQISALVEQLRSTERTAGLALAQASTPEQAAQAFGVLFERYAGPIQPVRAAQARAIYDQYTGSVSTSAAQPTGEQTVAGPVTDQDQDLALACAGIVATGGGLPAGGGVGQDTSSIPCANGAPGRIELAPGDVPIRICPVAAFNVNTLLVQNLVALLSAAAADGVNLSGGAFRSNSSQIALRQAHCGTSSYDVYQRPASQCRPPTAIPGRSMHEWGLAIDFTQDGRGLTRGSSGYAWLSVHAGTYGLINLPSESWHWSTSGR